MEKSQIFPMILITLDVLAAAVYAVQDGYIRKTIYWISAAILTSAVTF